MPLTSCEGTWVCAWGHGTSCEAACFHRLAYLSSESHALLVIASLLLVIACTSGWASRRLARESSSSNAQEGGEGGGEVGGEGEGGGDGDGDGGGEGLVDDECGSGCQVLRALIHTFLSTPPFWESLFSPPARRRRSARPHPGGPPMAHMVGLLASLALVLVGERATSAMAPIRARIWDGWPTFHAESQTAPRRRAGAWIAPLMLRLLAMPYVPRPCFDVSLSSSRVTDLNLEAF